MLRELAPSERAFVASSVRCAVDGAFAHWEGATLRDLDDRFRELLRATISRGDRRHFSLEMAAFLASLNNGHTLYRDEVAWHPFLGPMGFSAVPFGSKWVLTQGWANGPRAGQIIERTNGESTEEVYQRLKRYISASSERGRRRRLFSYTHLFPQRIVLRIDGRRWVIRRSGRSLAPAEGTSGRWLRRGSSAYIRIPSFVDPDSERRAVNLVTRFRKAPVLLIDVRGNTGGTTPRCLVDALMERPWRGWAESSPQHVGLIRAYAHLFEIMESQKGRGLHLTRERLAPLEIYRDWDRTHVLFPATLNQPQPKPFKGQVILLVDEDCGSACEDFLLPFKDTGRGVLVGATTNGSTGQPYILELPDGIRAFVGAKRCYFPDGRPFEGIGITPDHEVSRTPDDLLSGRDPVLQMATDLASQGL